MIRKKKPSDESFVRKLPVFSIMYMIRIRFSGPRELIWKEFRRARLRPELSHKVSRDKLCNFFQSCPCAHFCEHSDPCVLAQARAQKHRTLSLTRSDRERCDSLVVCCWMWLFEELNPRVGPRLNGRLISSSSSSSSPLFFSLHFFSVVSCFVFRFVFFCHFSLFSSFFPFSHFSLFHFVSFFVTCSGAPENMEL